MRAVVGDRVQVEAWRALLRAHSGLTEQLERRLQAEHELPLSWFEVLRTLDEAPDGRVRLQQLIDCALMTKSGVSRLVDRMEAAGLVRRESCPADRRGAYAALTESGRRRVRAAAPTHAAGIEEHIGRHLTEAEAGQLRDLLAALSASLGRGCPG
jgi:DNA-binding MarR family transcriptional regulator